MHDETTVDEPVEETPAEAPVEETPAEDEPEGEKYDGGEIPPNGE